MTRNKFRRCRPAIFFRCQSPDAFSAMHYRWRWCRSSSMAGTWPVAGKINNMYLVSWAIESLLLQIRVRMGQADCIPSGSARLFLETLPGNINIWRLCLVSSFLLFLFRFFPLPSYPIHFHPLHLRKQIVARTSNYWIKQWNLRITSSLTPWVAESHNPAFCIA